MKGNSPRSFISAATCVHCSTVRSAPVGLWQQACSNTTVPGYQLAQVGQHAGEVQAMRRGIEIGVVDDVEADCAPNTTVVSHPVADRDQVACSSSSS